MHKFKLKKDGKVVGYCKWTEDWGWKYYLDPNDPENTFTHFAVAQSPKGITAHPFVCLDKNGDEVYAGDKVKWPNLAISDFFNEDIVKFDCLSGAYVISPTGTRIAICNLKEIELIKD